MISLERLRQNFTAKHWCSLQKICSYCQISKLKLIAFSTLSCSVENLLILFLTGTLNFWPWTSNAQRSYTASIQAKS